jgi:hypothetical protein
MILPDVTNTITFFSRLPTTHFVDYKNSRSNVWETGQQKVRKPGMGGKA